MMMGCDDEAMIMMSRQRHMSLPAATATTKQGLALCFYQF
jgi:hypothetical protein